MVEATNICGFCKYFEYDEDLWYIGTCRKFQIRMIYDDWMCDEAEYDEDTYKEEDK